MNLFSRVLLAYKLALPLAVSNLIIFASGAIDYVFIGRLGERELAAASLALNVYFFIKIIGDGIALAIITLLGRHIEKNNYQAATTVLFNSAVALSIVSLLATPLLIGGSTLLELFEQPRELTGLTSPLFISLACSLLPSFIFTILVTYLAVLHAPGEVFKLSILYLGAKWLAGYYLFSVLEHGLASAGWSTTFSSFAAIGAACLYFYRTKHIHLSLIDLKLDKSMVVKVLTIGTPIGLLELSTIASTMVAAFFMAPFGESAIAANALAVLSIEIVIVLMFGFSDASAILVSQSTSMKQVRRNILAVLIAGLGFSLLLLAFLLAFKKHIPLLFLGDHAGSEKTFEMVDTFIEVALFIFVFDAIAIIFRGVMQGYGETGKQLIISLIGNWPIGLGSGLLLAYMGGYGAEGIWYGMAVGHLFTFTGMTVLVLLRNRRKVQEPADLAPAPSISP
jgi:MATE family multidrug resistance protein